MHKRVKQKNKLASINYILTPHLGGPPNFSFPWLFIVFRFRTLLWGTQWICEAHSIVCRWRTAGGEDFCSGCFCSFAFQFAPLVLCSLFLLRFAPAPMLVLCCASALPIHVLWFCSAVTLLFLLFCFCPSASVCCPCFSILGPLLLLCCSCSSCLAPLLLCFSACALLLLLFLLSCFPGLASLIFLLHFTSNVFNWNWNLGKFGFYSREGVLWSGAELAERRPPKNP